MPEVNDDDLIGGFSYTRTIITREFFVKIAMFDWKAKNIAAVAVSKQLYFAVWAIRCSLRRGSIAIERVIWNKNTN